MDLWGWVAWVVAVGTGVFGTWRAITTDRKYNATVARWEIVQIEPHETGLRSRLPYTARDVEIDPGDLIVRLPEHGDTPARFDRIPRKGVERIVIMRGFNSRDIAVTVRWKSRWLRHSEPVLIPRRAHQGTGGAGTP